MWRRIFFHWPLRRVSLHTLQRRRHTDAVPQASYPKSVRSYAIQRRRHTDAVLQASYPKSVRSYELNVWVRDLSQISRVVPITDLVGYPAYNFAWYRISGWPQNRISGLIEFFLSKINIYIFSFQQNLTTFLVAISLLFSTFWNCSDFLFIRSLHHLINRFSSFPSNETGYPAGYRILKKGRINRYNPTN